MPLAGDECCRCDNDDYQYHDGYQYHDDGPRWFFRMVEAGSRGLAWRNLTRPKRVVPKWICEILDLRYPRIGVPHACR